MSDEWVGQEAHAPDVVGTVLGYRAWSVGELDGAAYLTSLVQKVMWPSDGPLVAQHQVEGQGALVTLSIFHLREQPAVPPVQGCQCGVYA